MEDYDIVELRAHTKPARARSRCGSTTSDVATAAEMRSSTHVKHVLVDQRPARAPRSFGGWDPEADGAWHGARCSR